MEASKVLSPQCPGCGCRLCDSCDAHLAEERGVTCNGCLADEAFTAGLMSEKNFRAIAREKDKAEANSMACPECSGGRPCAPVCDECGVAEMQDRLRHERSHSPGSL